MSHLDYYTRHNISPVRYDLSSLGAHFQRRQALYRALGLLPLAIRGANVLEIAAGTGQNSLHIAALLPARLTLLEPNPTGITKIKESYDTLSLPHTKPTLIETKLEDYTPREKFDIVICENWLGASAHERQLLKKLAGFVEPGGVLIITCVSPSGLLFNVIRRALAAKLTRRIPTFEEKTRVLVDAFSPHLQTISSMTRTAVDWVHDNMLNPVYFNLCLTIPMVISDLGPQFQSVGVSPAFRRDWRWFKSIHGAAFEFNNVLIDEYYRNCHCLVDYRDTYRERQAAENQRFENAILFLLKSVERFEMPETHEDVGGHSGEVVAGLKEIYAQLKVFAPKAAGALLEALNLFDRQSITPAHVGQLRKFSEFFGRETMYVSFERMRDTPEDYS